MNSPREPLVEPCVRRELRDGVATLTLNRGARFNPLSQAMIAALQQELDGIATDPSLRAVVLAGEGRGFCAGHDLKELRAHADQAWQTALFAACARLMLTLSELPQPVIARVHGIAAAAGCQLVASCDLAVASEEASFSLPGINVGLFCSTPAVAVGRNLGRKRVMEMLLTGEPIDAATALDWGLVNRVVPSAELDAAVAGFTDMVRRQSAKVIALGKRAFYRQIDQGIVAAYAVTGDAMVENVLGTDAGEGIDAFFAKRPPRWRDD